MVGLWGNLRYGASTTIFSVTNTLFLQSPAIPAHLASRLDPALTLRPE